MVKMLEVEAEHYHYLVGLLVVEALQGLLLVEHQEDRVEEVLRLVDHRVQEEEHQVHLLEEPLVDHVVADLRLAVHLVLLDEEVLLLGDLQRVDHQVVLREADQNQEVQQEVVVLLAVVHQDLQGVHQEDLLEERLDQVEDHGAVHQQWEEVDLLVKAEERLVVL